MHLPAYFCTTALARLYRNSRHLFHNVFSRVILRYFGARRAEAARRQRHALLAYCMVMQHDLEAARSSRGWARRMPAEPSRVGLVEGGLEDGAPHLHAEHKRQRKEIAAAERLQRHEDRVPSPRQGAEVQRAQGRFGATRGSEVAAPLGAALLGAVRQEERPRDGDEVQRDEA